uniref:Uncharacterized protein n=1 Tax=Ciona savignyi TaxID=51511 RepID=H2Y6D9_CIOSA
MPQSSALQHSTRLEFDQNVRSRLSDSVAHLGSVYQLSKHWVGECGRLNRSDDATNITTTAMQGALNKAATVVYDQEPVYEAARLSLGNTMATMNAMVTAMQEGEYDCTKPASKIVPPVEKRAQALKSEMTDTDGLAKQIEDKDISITELRKALRTKSEDMSEAKIRIELLERKLEKSSKEGNEKSSL